MYCLLILYTCNIFKKHFFTNNNIIFTDLKYSKYNLGNKFMVFTIMFNDTISITVDLIKYMFIVNKIRMDIQLYDIIHFNLHNISIEY